MVWSSRHRVLPARPHPRARAPSARSGRASGLAAAAIAALALALAPGLASARKLAHGGAKSARGPSVSAALLGLEQSGAITPASYQHDYRAYLAAKRSLGRLGGTRRVELGAVLANVEAIAAAGGFTTSRLPALFLTLERNRQWWTTEPLLANGARVSFAPSKVVWQYYAGQGIEIQWLATFGKANAYYHSGHENANLRALLSEVLPLASSRAGGIAWEYEFRFDGGRPPWTSGLSQGTAVQALSRAYARFKEPEQLTAAQGALGVFRSSPPAGVRVRTAVGAHYAEYSYAPADRILNGFIQALVGLYDYTEISKDPLGLALFQAGDAEARAEVPHYDTGAWSLYDQFSESSLNYHQLLTEFLQNLCERTRRGPPLGQAGGAPIAGDEIYCTTARRFTADLRMPPQIALLTKALRGATRAGVQLSLSKISTVAMTVRQGARGVWSTRGTLERGRPRLLWPTPASGGTYSVTLVARDPAGNFATTSGTIVVSRH